MAKRVPLRKRPRQTIQRDSLGRKLTEKFIQSTILRWLKAKGIFHWRQNAGNIHRGPINIRLGPKGIPDIIVLLPPGGRFVGLEVKVPGRYQNPDQKAFQANLEAIGGLYFVVHSKEEAWEALLQAGCNIPMVKKARASKQKTVSVESDPWKL